MNLDDYLESRRVPYEVIQRMKDENVDAEAILGMKEEDLRVYLPKYGDRIAVVEYCKRQRVNKKPKLGLLERLQQKLQSRDSLPSRNTVGTVKSVQHKSSTRTIEFGWMHRLNDNNYVQIRTKQGGGTRKIKVNCQISTKELIEIGIKLFFTNGASQFGKVDEISFTIGDYRQNKFEDDEINITEMYEATGFRKLRLYLLTEKLETKSSNNNENYENEDSNEQCENANTANSGLLQSSVTPLPPISPPNQNDSFYSNDPFDEAFELNQYILPSDNESWLNRHVNSESVTTKLTFHRGQVFTEMVEAFLVMDIDKAMEGFTIEMILPNGQIEKAQDIGGVFRDSLSEFWQTFYEKCTTGTSFKIPFVRHDFGKDRWKAIARILYVGWKKEKYFPIKLSRAFVEHCFFKNSKSCIIDNFLKYVSDCEKQILSTALTNFDEIDLDELQDALDTFECKWSPTASNIKQLIEDIAHKEIIQKPMFVIDSWNEELSSLVKDYWIDLDIIYSTAIPTPKNLLSKLEINTESTLSSQMQTVFNYLKRYIKEADEKVLTSFLRFCTGADIVTPHPIQVSFLQTSGFGSSPIAHTCNFSLELPICYDNYPQFRSEMNSLLSSNIWIMDII